MEEHVRATNDLIKELVAKLTPQGREVLEEVEGIGDALVRREISEEEADSRTGAALERAHSLPPPDGDILMRVMELKERAYGVTEVEAAQEAERFRHYMTMIRRAQELERAEGKAPSQNMTLNKAVEVLRRHGELT